MKSFTSIIFLLLFATALAVPAVIFYTKWTNKRADDAALQVPGQNVSTAAVFTGFQDKSAASAEGGGRAVLTPRPAPSPGDGPAAYGGASTRTSGSQEGMRDTTSLPPPTPPASGAGNVTVAAVVPVSTHSLGGAYFNPKSDRDPTISPAEYAKIKDDAERLRAAERQRSLDKRRREKESGGENLIKLQGIVGQNVIINGEMYAAGDFVRGVKVKILKVGPNYVKGEYQGKQFTKIMR